MIRYVHIGNQIACDDDEPADQFAFYDTVRGKFVDLDGDQVFYGVNDLRESYAVSEASWPELDRLIELIPADKRVRG